MTQFPDLFSALAAPFSSSEVKTRSLSGRQMRYITARTAQNRLDNVLGPENWWTEFVPAEKSVECRLTIRLPDGQLLTKADAGAYADMADEGDGEKAGYSDAFKRACVMFGVSRYLYNDGVPAYAGSEAPKIHEPDNRAGAQPATRPAKAPPARKKPASQAGKKETPSGPIQIPEGASIPLSGKGLFQWVSDVGKFYEINLLSYMTKWGKLQEYPNRIVDWDAEQVKAGLAHAVHKVIDEIEAPDNESEHWPVIHANRLAASPSSSSPAGKSRTIPELRKELSDLIWFAAEINCQSADPGNSGYKATLEMFEVETGRDMPSVKECNNRELLDTFIAAAHVYINTNRKSA